MRQDLDTRLRLVSPPARVRVGRDRPARSRREAVAIEQAVAAERARVRAWLHDTTLQVLEYVAAGAYADTPDPAELARAAGVAATELRAFVDDDVPAEGGTLAERLQAVVAAAAEAGPHEVRLAVAAADGTVEGPEAHELVAAVGEALENVRKHASARHALVHLEVAEGTATVVVSDDGVGFDLGSVPPRAGLRRSVVGRLATVGGTARIASRPGAGTHLTLRVHAPGFETVRGAA